MWIFFWPSAQKLILSSGEEMAAAVWSKRLEIKGARRRTEPPIPPRVDWPKALESVGEIFTPLSSVWIDAVECSHQTGSNLQKTPANETKPVQWGLGCSSSRPVAHRDRWCCCCCWGRIPPAEPVPRSVWLAEHGTFRPRWTGPSGAPAASSSASAQGAPAGMEGSA